MCGSARSKKKASSHPISSLSVFSLLARGIFVYVRYSFSDETPSRFQKHVIKAVQQGPNNNNDHRAGTGSSDSVQIENLNFILENIGRSDARLSSEDENLLLREAGVAMDDANSDRRIPVSTIMRQLF